MKAQGIAGSVILAAGGLCPLMHLPIIGNWNYFDIDIRLAIAFYTIVVLALIGALTNKTGLIRFAGWGAIVLAIITLAGIHFKAHDSFSFLHFRKLVNLASGLVKYKWGWFVIMTGAILLITVRKPAIVKVQ